MRAGAAALISVSLGGGSGAAGRPVSATTTLENTPSGTALPPRMLNTGVREYNTIKYTFYVLKYVLYLYFCKSF